MSKYIYCLYSDVLNKAIESKNDELINAIISTSEFHNINIINIKSKLVDDYLIQTRLIRFPNVALGIINILTQIDNENIIAYLMLYHKSLVSDNIIKFFYKSGKRYEVIYEILERNYKHLQDKEYTFNTRFQSKIDKLNSLGFRVKKKNN